MTLVSIPPITTVNGRYSALVNWVKSNQHSLGMHHLVLNMAMRYMAGSNLVVAFYLWSKEFRSQSSDNMDRWTSTGGKSQRTKEKKRDDQRRERVRRKKIQVHEKVGKSRFTVFFQ